MTPKELVLNFYNSDALYNPDTLKGFLHSDIILNWNSSKGFVMKNKEELIQLATDLQNNYTSHVIQMHQIVAEANLVTVHYTHFATTIENPNHIHILAHFMVIWEVENNTLFKGYQMSQQP